MPRIATLSLALLLSMAAAHALPVPSAPAYVRKARNATNNLECTAFLTTWDSCCDILRLFTNYTRPEVNSTTATNNSISNHTRATSRLVNSTNQLIVVPDIDDGPTNPTDRRIVNSTNSSSSRPTDTAATNLTASVLSRVYNLNHYGPFSATYGYCDMETDGGGWLVIFRREDSLDFQKNLKEYEDGFGTLEAGRSFWYGLKALNHITSRGAWELRVDLVDSNEHIHAHYSSIVVGDARDGYILRLGAYVAEKSTAYNSLQEFDGKMFYTKDNDGDRNCAKVNQGGWWFDDTCSGRKGGVLTSHQPFLRGWYDPMSETTRTFDRTELKIRQLGCSV